MLTAKRIERLRKKPGRYLDGGDVGRGLYLQITDGGASWLLRYERTIGGKRNERWMGLGSLRDFSLKQARERARQQRQLLADGIDPLEQKRAARAAAVLQAAKSVTFEDAATQFHRDHADQWRNAKHRAQFINTLRTYAFPVIGNLPAADVDVGLVLKVLEQEIRDPGEPVRTFWKARQETASRVRGRIETVLDWCTVRGYRKGDNPARWRGHLEHVLSERSKNGSHHPALPYQQMPEFMVELRQREGVAAKALEFTILVAARTGETIGAKENELDLKEKVWTVPEGRIKGEKEHKVPLPDAAIAILEFGPS